MSSNVRRSFVVATTTVRFFCDCGEKAQKTFKHVPDQKFGDRVFIESAQVPVPDGWKVVQERSEPGPGHRMKSVCPECQEGKTMEEAVEIALSYT